MRKYHTICGNVISALNHLCVSHVVTHVFAHLCTRADDGACVLARVVTQKLRLFRQLYLLRFKFVAQTLKIMQTTYQMIDTLSCSVICC